MRPASGITPGSTSAWTTFEAPDPAVWVPAGYALLVVDATGTVTLSRQGGAGTLASIAGGVK